MYQLFDFVTFVVKKPECYGEVPQAFVFDSTNKAQEKTAMKWAGKDFDYSFMTENKEFRIKLGTPASYASVGGRLSYWDCIIYKDNTPKEQYLVGINTDFLFELLNEANWEKGTCTSLVSFGKDDGVLGVLTDDMKSCAMKDMEFRDFIKHSKKTTKYKVGHMYQTLTKNDIYLGQMTQYNYETIIRSDSSCLILPHRRNILVDYNLYNQYAHNSLAFVDYMNYYLDTLDVLLSAFKEKSSNELYWKVSNTLFRVFFNYNLSDEKLPSRVEGKESIVFPKNPHVLEDFEDEYKQRILEFLKIVLESDKIRNVDSILNLYFLTYKDTSPELPEELTEELRTKLLKDSFDFDDEIDRSLSRFKR